VCGSGCGHVRNVPHHTAQRINFVHEMTLARATDGRIARQVGDILQPHGEHGHLRSHARSGESRFDSRVTAANDGYLCFIE